MKNNFIGSSFDDFLAEEGISEVVEAGSIKQLIAYQLQEAIEKNDLRKPYWQQGLRPPVLRSIDFWIPTTSQ